MAQFEHEKLRVYQQAPSFVSWADDFARSMSGGSAAKDHLDRAATSIVLNIAEANGKFAVRDRCRFLEIARGSALECAACLDVLVAKGLAQPERVTAGKNMLDGIMAMLTGLRTSLLDRLSEEGVEYRLGR